MPLKSIKNNLPDSELFITRKRKKYKFAKFDELENCWQFDEVAGKIESLTQRATTAPNRSRRGGAFMSAERPLGRGFDFAGNLVVELGAGTGLLSVELARRHPENFYIALDIKSDRLYTGAKLATELGLGNIAFVRAEAKHLPEVVPDGLVSQIWLTFPDPYANQDQTGLKKSDAKHRLSAPRYLELYSRALQKQNGVLHFKTDNQPLFDWSKEQLERAGWKISELSHDLHSSDLPDDYKIKTSYETRFSEQGLPIYYLTATIKS